MYKRRFRRKSNIYFLYSDIQTKYEQSSLFIFLVADILTKSLYGVAGAQYYLGFPGVRHLCVSLRCNGVPTASQTAAVGIKYRDSDSDSDSDHHRHRDRDRDRDRDREKDWES